MHDQAKEADEHHLQHVKNLQKDYQETEALKDAEIKNRDRYAGRKGASDKAAHTTASKLVAKYQMRLGKIRKQLAAVGASPLPALPVDLEHQPSTSASKSFLIPDTSSAGSAILGKRTSKDTVQERKRPRTICGHGQGLESTPGHQLIRDNENREGEAEMQLIADLEDFKGLVPPKPKESRLKAPESAKDSQPTLSKASSTPKVDEGPVAKDSSRRTADGGHLADKWDRLLPEQQTKLIEIGERALDEFENSRTLPSHQVRTWAQRESTYLREVGDHSEVCSMAMHIIKGGKSQCAAHTVATTKREKRHDENTEDVTGVPWAPLPRVEPEAQATKATEEEEKKKSVSLRELHHRLLEHFPLRDGRRTLHCGCDFKEVLFGFWLFKRVPMISSRSNPDHADAVRPLDPLTRHIVYMAFSKLGFRINNLYRFDMEGNPQDPAKIANAFVQDVRGAFFSRIPRSLPPPPNNKGKEKPKYVEVSEKQASREEEKEIFGGSESE